MSGIPGMGQNWQSVWANFPENPYDNDTSAGEHGSRSGVRGMLQRGKGAAGYQAAMPGGLNIFRPTPGERKL